MKNAHPFGAVLARLRREAGFRNPHSFYKSRGGAGVLGLSYANYLALERGRSLPKPARLKAVLMALDLPARAPARAALIRAYLGSLLGDDALLRELDAAGAGPAAQSLGEETAARAVRQKTVHLTPAQWRAQAEDPAADDLHTYLVNTPGFVSLREAAAVVGLEPADAKRAVKALAAAKLVEVSDGRIRSRISQKLIGALPVSPATAGLTARLLKNRAALLSRSKLRHDWWVSARFLTADFERYTARLDELLSLGSVYGDAEPGPDTRVYAVSARVFELFP